MEKEVVYCSIEKVVYKFTETDILAALTKEYRIKLVDCDYEFDLFDDRAQYYYGAELVLKRLAAREKSEAAAEIEHPF